MNLEDGLNRLEEITKIMEDDNVDFDCCIKLYSEAGEILKNSFEKIKEGKGKIVEINEKLQEIDFEI